MYKLCISYVEKLHSKQTNWFIAVTISWLILNFKSSSPKVLQLPAVLKNICDINLFQYSSSYQEQLHRVVLQKICFERSLIFTGKHLCSRFFFNDSTRLQELLRAYNFIKKGTLTQMFSWEFSWYAVLKFLRKPFYRAHVNCFFCSTSQVNCERIPSFAHL